MSKRLICLVSFVLVLGLAIGLVSTAQAEPKYVIFLIGDGMGLEQVKAAGMYASGEAGILSFELFPYNGELTTYAADAAITDSAAAGTALATGVKVNKGVISMAYPGDGSELESLLEYSKAQGKSTGLVTTKTMTDATPACFGAHEPSRDNIIQITDDYRLQTQPNVLLGGGGSGMNIKGFKDAGYTVVTDCASMQALDTENISMVSGQFGNDNLPYEYDGLGALPHLSEMTTTALDILDNDPDGFFLMVEGGLIDDACHGNDLQRAVLETVEFGNTVQVAIDWAAGRSDTLILVSADHETGGLTVLANNGAGVLPTVAWSTGSHTAANVPVYAWGVNAKFISGVMDNTEMFRVVTSGPEAGNPNPSDGATDVPQEVALTWRPGTYVEGLSPKHRIFFSESFDDVNDGIGGIEQDVARYPIEGSLSLDKGRTCYWRVDETNSTTSWDEGAIWRFKVIDHFVLDDFESYNDLSPGEPNSNRIFLTWIDGKEQPTNGAIVGYADPPFAERGIVHGGRQAMPYYYDNTAAATYSQAQRTFSPAQDWTGEDVDSLSLWFRGNPAYVGSFVEEPPGTYTMTASGTDIWDKADEFHFAYKELYGAAAIIAKVESVENTDSMAKAGVMIRDTLDADSANVLLAITPEKTVTCQRRTAAGGGSVSKKQAGITTPQWVRLERMAGGLVRAYYSADGTTWTPLDMAVVRMNMPVYIGLAVTSHNVDLTCEAKFSDVSFPDISVDPQWTDQDIGILSNAPEPMYVTVEDGSGTAATVYHNDPDAAMIDTWTQWTIDTKEFGDAGVVLTDVSKLAIGFGGADNPQPGGSGLMYFDVIRLYLPAQEPEPAP